MAKFFLVLTLIAAGAAAGLGWVTYQKIGTLGTTLTNTRKELKTAQADATKAKLDLKDAQDQLAATKTQLDTANATIATNKTTIDGLTGQVATLTSSVSSVQAQLAEETDKYNKEVDLYNSITGHKPETPGSPTDELMKQINELKLTNDTLTKKAAEAENHATALQKQMDQHTATLNKPGIEGMVMAVNPGYGFAVVSVGDRQGSVPNAELLVERDGKQIAKLKVTTVEPALSVADIIPDTLAKGQRILPGDKVIFSGQLAQ